MAIDGSKIGKQPASKDVYESPLIGFVAHAIVWVPVAALIWFAYWSGTWMGGWIWGIVSVLSTAATVGIFWAMMRRKHHR